MVFHPGLDGKLETRAGIEPRLTIPPGAREEVGRVQRLIAKRYIPKLCKMPRKVDAVQPLKAKSSSGKMIT
jgi:hypothetical protein